MGAEATMSNGYALASPKEHLWHVSRCTRTLLIFFFVLIVQIQQSHVIVEAAPATDAPSQSPAGFFESLWKHFVPQGDSNVRGPEDSSQDGTREFEGLLLTPKSVNNSAAIEAASKLYDAIIVGGGAVGCPLARTLADAGKDVLLIERGGARKDHPESLDIYGAGIVIDNKDVSQLVVTTDGVLSHIANVLSGGSAINMAIIIKETNEYFDFLKKFPGVSFDDAKLEQAQDWTVNWLSHPMPETLPYGQRWRLGVEQIFGPSRGYSHQLGTNTSWGGSSGFDSDNNWFRAAADVALGIPGIDFPKTLQILLQHIVHRIVFELDPKTGNQKATCVEFAKTTAADIAPIVGKRTVLGVTVPNFPSFFSHLFKGGPEFSALIPSGKKYRACVKPGGQIISSAGALLTPLLMYKSGVGPKEFVDRLRVPLIKDFPEIGQNIKDRVFIPIGLFFKGETPSTGFPPRVCQSIAMSQIGPNCENFQLGERSLSCTVATAEELSGARIGEGTIYATRYVIPVQHRNDPLFDVAFRVIKDCSNGRPPLGNILLNTLCPITQPLANCFRKVAANFYFTAEPKSQGKIHIGPGGEMTISGNYLTDAQDMEDAMRGVANIIRVVNSGVYDDVVEPAGLDSCPMLILNGLWNLLDEVLVNHQDIEVTGMSSVEATNSAKKVIEDQIKEFKEEAKKAEEWKKQQESSSADDKELEGNWFNVFGNIESRKYWTSQKYATYPPTIPEPSDSVGLKKFAKAYMTSIWHWVGSAAMGSVVDDHFVVKGFDNLRIIDASILNQVTRMNPYFTLASIGRYAGLLLNEETGDLPSPPV